MFSEDVIESYIPHSIIKQIEEADDLAISRIIEAVIKRFSRLYPEWEVVFFSLHRDQQKRAEDIKELVKRLEMEEKEDSLG